ncbi:MAG: YwiC-like family protein [Ilumatobacteraceae bacterium]
MTAARIETGVRERSKWRVVALPSEHGGWGLTFEPVLLGLLLAWSGAGVALGVTAFAAFLVRTPLKLAAVDHRRGRWLDRSALAVRIALAEMVVIAVNVAVAISLSGWRWSVPILIAVPFVALELSYEVRSRGRRIVPELCGAIGISAVSASIVVAGGGSSALAAAAWTVLAARAVGSIPFVRTQILRLRRGSASTWPSDVAQAVSVVLGLGAVVVDERLELGAAAVVVLALAQVVWLRRDPMPAKQLGLRQMAIGIGLVAMAALGVRW